MKKNSIEHRFDLQEWLKKLVPLVLAALLVCGGLSRAQAGSVTDEEKVSFPKRELTVEQVFDAIMKQLKYEVFYSENELHAKRLVALPREEMELTEVLNFVLEDKFTYTITGRTIVIRPAVKREPEKERRVAGVVKDEEGNPLPGVSVLIKGTTLGVSTNVKGQYTIVIPQSVKNPHLLFSFVGMESVTLPATRDSIYVTLKMDVQQMEEVVVRTADSKALRVYVSPLPTAYRFHTFLEDRLPRWAPLPRSASGAPARSWEAASRCGCWTVSCWKTLCPSTLRI